MKVREIMIKIYGCDVCGEEYGDDERTARKCEKLPVEKITFAIGDKVITPESELLPGFPCEGIVVKRYLVSPLKSEDSTARLRCPRDKHFYLYDVRSFIGGVSTHPARHLKLMKKKK